MLHRKPCSAVYGRRNLAAGIALMLLVLTTLVAQAQVIKTSQPVPYGSPRADTAKICDGGNTSSGFGLLFNFNILGGGKHTAQLYVNGAAIGEPRQFMVTAHAGEFLDDGSRRAASGA